MQTHSDQINELITALSKAQGEIKPAIKSSINPHFKNKYADLTEVWDACREPISKHNLAIIQTMGKDENGILNLITTLAHSSGQWIKSFYPLMCKDPTNPQQWGSCITYARRYTLSSIIGITPDEDDDGNQASGISEKKNKTAQKPQINGTHEDTIKQKMINENQWTELRNIILQLDEDVQQKVWQSIEAQNIHDYTDMPEDFFNKVKNRCLINLKSRPAHAVN